MAHHELKTWPDFFADVQLGLKNFEVRKDDRGFIAGDILLLREWSPEQRAYTGARIKKQVMYVLQGGQFGVEPGYVVMGLGDL